MADGDTGDQWVHVDSANGTSADEVPTGGTPVHANARAKQKACIGVEHIRDGRTYIYATTPPDDLACAVCLTSVMEAPSQLIHTSCQHTFCRDCIEEWIRHSKACPVCRRRGSHLKDKPPQLIARCARTEALLGALPVHCPAGMRRVTGAEASLLGLLPTEVVQMWLPLADGCHAVLRRDELTNHMTACAYVPLSEDGEALPGKAPLAAYVPPHARHVRSRQLEPARRTAAPPRPRRCSAHLPHQRRSPPPRDFQSRASTSGAALDSFPALLPVPVPVPVISEEAVVPWAGSDAAQAARVYSNLRIRRPQAVLSGGASRTARMTVLTPLVGCRGEQEPCGARLPL